MGIPYTQRVGEKHNMLTILRITGKENTGSRTKTRCMVLCECGVEKDVRIEGVVNGQQYSCGCTRKKFSNSALRKMYNNYRNSAVSRGYSFELSESDFERISSTDCHYCGIQASNFKFAHRDVFVLNGIDRKDNTKGYTLENSLPCCSICNRAKGILGYDEFILWLERVCAFVSNDERTTIRT